MGGDYARTGPGASRRQADLAGWGWYVETLAADWDCACGLRDFERASCWGNNSNGQAQAPGGPWLTNVAAGQQPRLRSGVQSHHHLLGNNTHGRTDPPDGRFTAVTAGGNHNRALRADRTVACRGVTTPAGRFGPQVTGPEPIEPEAASRTAINTSWTQDAG